MKQLLILRHAKSSWADPGQDDHDRPLNARGREAATSLGDRLRAQDLVPDQVLCSSAARTQETAALLSLPVPIEVHPALYLADADAILDHVKTATASRVMVIGHNPGIAAFAATFGRPWPAHPRFRDYPTAALTVIECDIRRWPHLTPSNSALVAFGIPSDTKSGGS